MTEAFIPYSTQDIDDSDIAAVVRVLKSPLITQGPSIKGFENAIAAYCQVPHAVAVSSGTAALHIALAALDINPETRVWTSPLTFVGSANAARMLGAQVDFVDIDPTTGNIDANALKEKIEKARLEQTLPKALLVVHYAGRSCDMVPIQTLCEAHDIAVIEDAAHALGAQYADGLNVGHGHFGEASIFSFHPVKSITTGEGGMVTTRNSALADRLRRLRSHGICRDPGHWLNHAEAFEQSKTWYYEQLELGYNYRITDFQAALGESQLKRLSGFIFARRQLAARYHELLAGLPLELPPPSDTSAWHLYVVRLREDAGRSRRELFDALRDAGVGVNVHYIPVHLQPYYARLGFRAGDFPASESFYASAVSLPLYPKLTYDQQDYIAECVRKALK